MPPLSLAAIAVLKATLILGLAFVASLALRRHTASSRYFVWVCACLAALAIPALTAFTPAWSIEIAPSVLAPASEGPPLTMPPAAPSGVTAAAVPARVAQSWPLLAWAAGMLVMLAYLATGYVRMKLLVARAQPLRAEEWTRSCEHARALLNMRQSAPVLRSDGLDVPVTCGALSPVIVLPADSDGWSAERRRIVLVHEFIHARRRDPLWHLMSRFLVAVHWFNPLAWLAAARLRREQESACDDAVLGAGAGAAEYAEHLVEMARNVVAPAKFYGRPAIGMAAGLDLEQRVRAVLDPARKRGALSRRFCLATTAVTIALMALGTARGQASHLASLSGSVYDASGAAVPHATVLLTNMDGDNREITQTGEAGEYTFRGIPAGRYNATVEAPGFKRLQQPGLDLAPGASGRHDFTLDIGEIREHVQVVGKGQRAISPGPPRRIRVGGNVQATKLISRVSPAYPPDAEAEGVEGTVLLRAVISKTGDLMSISVVNSGVDPRLAKAAVDAVSLWRYQPTLLNGTPVEVDTTITVTFRLERE